MINFVAKKHWKNQRVSKLLSISNKLNHFTNGGPVKRMLENELRNILELSDHKDILCVSNGTAALHVLMFLAEQNAACKLRWVTPSFTFPSSVVSNSFDVSIEKIDPDTKTLPVDIGNHYDGIIITNTFGSNANVEHWSSLKDKVVIFDNASSPMSIINGRNMCNYGKYSFGSLHHTKYLGVGEGGFVIVPKDEYEIVESISNFGFRHSRDFNTMSSNFKMSDITAAYILSHLEKYNKDKHIYNQTQIIKNIPDNIQLFNYSDGIVYGNLPVLFNNNVDNMYFTNLGIITGKYYKPLLEDDVVANDIYNRIVNFPLNDSMSKSQIETIINAIKEFARIN